MTQQQRRDEMSYRTKEETVNGRKVVTVYYDRQKDDFMEALEWVKEVHPGGITIFAKPKEEGK